MCFEMMRLRLVVGRGGLDKRPGEGEGKGRGKCALTPGGHHAVLPGGTTTATGGYSAVGWVRKISSSRRQAPITMQESATLKSGQ